MDPRRLLVAAALVTGFLAGLFVLGTRTAGDVPALPPPPTADLPPPPVPSEPGLVRGPAGEPRPESDPANPEALAEIQAIPLADTQSLLERAQEADREEDHEVALAAAERGIAAAAHFDALNVARDLDALHKIRVAALAGLDAPDDEVRAAAAEWYAHNAAHDRNTAWAEEVCKTFGEPCGAGEE